MIEEAAGTKLYESKRESAKRTIEKKDAKLQEMDSVRSSGNKSSNNSIDFRMNINYWDGFQILSEEINPTLARLKEERSSYLEYQKVVREIEHLNKLCIAYKFLCAEVCKKIGKSA